MMTGIAFVALTWTAAAEPQRETRDEAVEKALNCLSKNQERDGSWLSQTRQKSPAITALAVMAFLSGGNAPDKGPYGDTVLRGIRCILDQQMENGLIAPEGGLEMYHHGICTLMLAQSLPHTEGELAKEVEGK